MELVYAIPKENTMSRIVINGVTVGAGRNVSIIDGRVVVDGKAVSMDGALAEAKVFHIVVEGSVERVEGAFATVKVEGNGGAVKTMSGDITVKGDVSGSVETMSGDVKVRGSVGGSVRTVSGDIRH
jgi:DUF4097 and DUF4098 domain-containing protein YvlB